MNRLCFESYDPNLYLNPNALVFKQKVANKPKREFISNGLDITEGRKIDRILKWWKKSFDFKEGARNNNVFILACSFSEFGVSKSTTESLLYSFECPDFTIKEIDGIINSAYSKTEFNSKSF